MVIANWQVLVCLGSENLIFGLLEVVFLSLKIIVIGERTASQNETQLWYVCRCSTFSAAVGKGLCLRTTISPCR